MLLLRFGLLLVCLFVWFDLEPHSLASCRNNEARTAVRCSSLCNRCSLTHSSSPEADFRLPLRCCEASRTVWLVATSDSFFETISDVRRGGGSGCLARRLLSFGISGDEKLPVPPFFSNADDFGERRLSEGLRLIMSVRFLAFNVRTASENFSSNVTSWNRRAVSRSESRCSLKFATCCIKIHA